MSKLSKDQIEKVKNKRLEKLQGGKIVRKDGLKKD